MTARGPGLLTRLLATSLTIAVIAVVATAWLATRTTSDRIIRGSTSSLEADGFIYSQLMRYAVAHRDWDEVGPVVDGLSERTGRRIALTTPDGELLVDSAASSGAAARPLPELPAVLLDPVAPLLPVSTGDATDEWSSLGLPAAAVTLTDDELRELEERAAGASRCLVDAGIAAATIARRTGATVIVEEFIPEETLLDCRVHEVDRPGTQETLLRRELSRAQAVCLADHDIPYVTEQPQATSNRFLIGEVPIFVTSGLDLTMVGVISETGLVDDLWSLGAIAGRGIVRFGDDSLGELELSADGIEADLATPGVRVMPLPRDAAERQAVVSCDEQARREVFSPFLASPALLHLDWAETPAGWFWEEGGGRTFAAVALVLAVTVGATVLLVRRLVTPLQALTTAAQQLQAGDHGSRVTVRRRDELGRLATAFNAMAATLQGTEQQRRAMVSDVAHELRSPLTNLRAHLEAARDGVIEVDGELLDSLLDESVLLGRLVDDLQQLALADAGQLRLDPEPLDAAEVVRQVAHAHRAAAVEAGVTLLVGADGPLPVEADPARLRQALGNLVANALRYTPDGGTVTIRGASTDHHAQPATDERSGAGEGTIVLAVADTGPGIAAEHLPKLFDRFTRVDPSRSRETGGSGLGLAITRTLVEAHGGTVDVASVPGEGATFTIRLPRRPHPTRVG